MLPKVNPKANIDEQLEVALGEGAFMAMLAMIDEFIEKLEPYYHHEFLKAPHNLSIDTEEWFCPDSDLFRICHDCADRICLNISNSIELGFCLLASEGTNRAAKAAAVVWSVLGWATGYAWENKGLWKEIGPPYRPFLMGSEITFFSRTPERSSFNAICDGCYAELEAYVDIEDSSELEYWESRIKDQGIIELDGVDAAYLYSLLNEYKLCGRKYLEEGLMGRIFGIISCSILPNSVSVELQKKEAAENEIKRNFDIKAARYLAGVLGVSFEDGLMDELIQSANNDKL